MDWNIQNITPQDAAAQAVAGMRPQTENQAQAPDGAKAQAAAPLTKSEVEDLAGTIQTSLLGKGVSLTFKVLDGDGGLQVEIRDADNGRLIRKTPPDELLALAKDLKKTTGGLLDKPA